LHNLVYTINQSIFIMPEGSTKTHNKMLKQEKTVQKQTQKLNLQQ